MTDASNGAAPMEIAAADESHVGTVDRVESGWIELTRKDSAEGEHRHVILGSDERVDEHVRLAADASAT